MAIPFVAVANAISVAADFFKSIASTFVRQKTKHFDWATINSKAVTFRDAVLPRFINAYKIDGIRKIYPIAQANFEKALTVWWAHEPSNADFARDSRITYSQWEQQGQGSSGFGDFIWRLFMWVWLNVDTATPENHQAGFEAVWNQVITDAVTKAGFSAAGIDAPSTQSTGTPSTNLPNSSDLSGQAGVKQAQTFQWVLIALVVAGLGWMFIRGKKI